MAQTSPSLPSTAKMDGDAKRYEQRGVSADKGDVHAAIKTLDNKKNKVSERLERIERKERFQFLLLLFLAVLHDFLH